MLRLIKDLQLAIKFYNKKLNSNVNRSTPRPHWISQRPQPRDCKPISAVLEPAWCWGCLRTGHVGLFFILRCTHSSLSDRCAAWKKTLRHRTLIDWWRCHAWILRKLPSCGIRWRRWRWGRQQLTRSEEGSWCAVYRKTNCKLMQKVYQRKHWWWSRNHRVRHWRIRSRHSSTSYPRRRCRALTVL